MGDYTLSPVYDLLNTRIHVEDADFALEDDLLPRNIAVGNVWKQFNLLADKAEINLKQKDAIFNKLLTNSDKVKQLIEASYLNDKIKRNYLQAYQTRLKKLKKHMQKV